MKVKKKLLFVMLFSIFVLAVFHTTCYAGTQNMRNLEYDAKLTASGDMEVIETWNIYVSNTNTLFKTFTLNSNKYKEITDVQVSQVQKDGTEKKFTQIDQEMYHVTKNCYYGLQTGSNKFEIAWGVGLDDSSATNTYKIKYKVVDAIKIYKDCSELYWMFLSTENAIPVKHVKGTIQLPSPVSQKDYLRAWAHGPLNGNIAIPNESTVTFEVDDLATKTMLEVRIATLENVFTQSTNMVDGNQFERILAEETNWANEANQQREKNKQREILMNIVIAVIEILVFIVALKKIIKYHKTLKQLKETPKEEIEKIQYFRDIPGESVTPAQAAFLYYFKNVSLMEQHLSEVLSAAMLDLCMKQYISFMVEKEKKKEIVKVTLLKETEKGLDEDEAKVYELLQKIDEKYGQENSFEIKDIEKYAKKNYTTFLKALTKQFTSAKEKQIEQGKYDKEAEKARSEWMGKTTLTLVLFIFLTIGIPFAFGMLGSIGNTPTIWGIVAILLELIWVMILCRKIMKQYSLLTIKGRQEKEQWEALKRYMEDFSMMDEKEVPELVLWEKYLVYATAFGIADKVLKQLKVKYPQLTDEDYLINHGYTYLYLANNNYLERNIVRGVSSAVRSAQSSANSSSGGGYGGGFSSGGGGRRWRRPEWEEDNPIKIK